MPAAPESATRLGIARRVMPGGSSAFGEFSSDGARHGRLMPEEAARVKRRAGTGAGAVAPKSNAQAAGAVVIECALGAATRGPCWALVRGSPGQKAAAVCGFRALQQRHH